MRNRVHRLINHLTAISGYTQIVLMRKPSSSLRAELEKIVQAVNSASEEVRSCVASLNEVEEGKPGPYDSDHCQSRLLSGAEL
jgi:hypothetical protein